MDDRQAQIREGAGLEESRINRDFINFLNKWSSPVIMTLAIAALAWAGWRWLEQRRLERIDQAFGDLADATSGGNPSPASLLALADEYEGIRAVPTLAKLYTIDVYLDAYIRGVQPGAEVSPFTGEPVNETDALDDEQRALYLERARALSRELVETTGEDPERTLLAINALFRAAAVAECERDFEGAKGHYERVIERAQGWSLPSLSELARRRIAALDAFDPDLILPDATDLQPLPGQSVHQPATGIPPEMLEQLEGLRGSPSPGPSDPQGSRGDGDPGSPSAPPDPGSDPGSETDEP